MIPRGSLPKYVLDNIRTMSSNTLGRGIHITVHSSNGIPIVSVYAVEQGAHGARFPTLFPLYHDNDHAHIAVRNPQALSSNSENPFGGTCNLQMDEMDLLSPVDSEFVRLTGVEQSECR